MHDTPPHGEELAVAETWLSQEAYDRLSEELETLRTEGREQISKEIEIARAHGDLRENAEYHAAKDEQGKMEARIRQLEHLLRDAKVGEPDTDLSEARPGLLVTIEIDGDVETWLLGSREDEHDEHDVLSAESPIGKALIGAKPGDTVTAQAPAGSFEVTLKDVALP
ncbi:MAG: transcription elongation factor GreA [Actinomycetes bacterium]